MNQVIFSNGIIIFYIFQRVSELIISKKNEAWLVANCGAIEADPKESMRMKLFHSTWFLCLIIESNLKTANFNVFSLIIGMGLICCLLVRFYTIRKLKQFWSVKIYKMKNQVITTEGLYRFLRHPNYSIVILELFLIPLLFKTYITLVIFSLLNLIVLANRIKLEEGTLMKQSDYEKKFLGIKRLVPFIFSLSLLFSFEAISSELNFNYKNYNEAHKANSFVKFESISTKLGFISSTFDGYALSIKISYDLVGDQVQKLEVIIPVKSLDTDNGSRNEKMWDDILEASKFPEIHSKITAPLTLSEGEKTVDMLIQIKGKEITRPVKLTVAKKDGKFHVSGSTTLGLKEANIPDPSIAIATVRDSFDLKFDVLIH
ncbi:MAG: YceI family protein [Bdellovibrionales bacterium]|nr:YceI family protein [Bdellovibrionales bacterium]